MTQDLPCPKFLRNILRYDPDTGKLFWLERTTDMFVDGMRSAEHACKAWNSRHAGKEAFTSIGSHGYRVGGINGNNFRAHRVIWAIAYGQWPEQEIDHINGIKHDNRLENLRSVSHAENHKNQKRHSNNTSGVVGVYLIKRSGKWRAEICVGGKSKSLGNFTDMADAIAARQKAEQELGFHKNHGRK